MTRPSPMFRRFSNGISAAVEPLPWSRALAVCLRFTGGVSEEPENRLGLAHVMQTALWKGTARRNASAILDAFDFLGAERSHTAGTEALTFRVELLPDRVSHALSLYREIFESAVFPPEEVELAKRLALETIRSLEDQPRSKVLQLALQAALGDPLGRPKAGTPETVPAIRREDASRYLERIAHPAGLMVTAAGGIDPSLFFDAVEAAFGGWEHSGERFPSRPVHIRAESVHEFKESDQAHIVIVYPGAPANAPDFYAAALAGTVLSGGASSRLFTEVREKRGLVYHVSTRNVLYRSGAITLLYAGTRVDRVDETLAVCLGEVETLADHITEENLERAKSMLLGRLRTVGELSAHRASALMDDLFLLGRPRPVEEIERSLAEVTLASAREAAARYAPVPRAVVVLGARKPETFA